MATRQSTRRWRFWVLALLWLPAGVVATAAVRFLPGHGLPETGGMAPAMLLMSAGSLLPVAPAACRSRSGAVGCGGSGTDAPPG